MESDFKEELSYCPDFWRYVPLDGAKAPNEPEYHPEKKRMVKGYGWGKKPYTLEEVCTKPKQAVGLFLGPVSRTGSVDFDGPDSDKTFDFHCGDAGELFLPDTIANTSGRPSHYQMFFEVPEAWFNKINKITLPPPPGTNYGKVELRFGNEKAFQSVLLGKHPNKKRYNWETGKDEEVPVGTGDGQGYYSWCKNANPKEQRLALMPTKLLEIWAEKSYPSKIILSDRAIEATGKSIDQLEDQQQKLENSKRLKKGLTEWFKAEHYYQRANDNYIHITMEVKSLGWEDYGDPDYFYQDWLEWCLRDPDKTRRDNEGKLRSVWDSFGVGGKGHRYFASFIARAIQDSFLGPDDIPKATKDNPPKKPVDFLEAATSAVEIIEKGWEKIKFLSRPAERTAGYALLQKQAGLTAKDFGNVVRDLIAQDNTDDIKYSTFEDLMKAKDLRPNPLVDRFLPKARLVLMAAEGGTGKSSICYEIAEAISTGNKLFDHLSTSIGNVKIIQCDESPVDAATKIELMDLQPDGSKISFKWSFNPSMIPDLEKDFERDKTDLCIMDSLVSIFGAGNDLNTPEVGLYLYEINKIASKTNTTVLIPHHLKKDQNQKKKKKAEDPDEYRSDVTKDDLYGNAFIFNAASDVWGLWVSAKEFGQKVFRLKNVKNRSMTAPSDHTYTLKGSEETLRFSLSIRSNGDIDKAHSVEKAALLFLEKNRPNKYTVKEIYKKVSDVRGIMNGEAHLGAMLARLFSKREVTGVCRCKSSEKTGGRPSYVYWKR